MIRLLISCHESYYIYMMITLRSNIHITLDKHLLTENMSQSVYYSIQAELEFFPSGTWRSWSREQNPKQAPAVIVDSSLSLSFHLGRTSLSSTLLILLLLYLTSPSPLQLNDTIVVPLLNLPQLASSLTIIWSVPVVSIIIECFTKNFHFICFKWPVGLSFEQDLVVFINEVPVMN